MKDGKILRKNPAFRGIATVLVSVIIWFSPIPAGVGEKAWHLFAIFFGTIAGLILQPLPLGCSADRNDCHSAHKHPLHQ